MKLSGFEKKIYISQVINNDFPIEACQNEAKQMQQELSQGNIFDLIIKNSHLRVLKYKCITISQRDVNEFVIYSNF